MTNRAHGQVLCALFFDHLFRWGNHLPKKTSHPLQFVL